MNKNEWFVFNVGEDDSEGQDFVNWSNELVNLYPENMKSSNFLGSKREMKWINKLYEKEVDLEDALKIMIRMYSIHKTKMKWK